MKPKRPASAAAKAKKGKFSRRKAQNKKHGVKAKHYPASSKATPPGRALNARQEKFAREYASGKTAAEAYREAYGPGESTDAAASRLLSSVKVAARVSALQAEAAAGAVLSLQDTLVYLRRVVVTEIAAVDAHSDLCQAWKRKQEGGARGRLKRGKADRGNEVDDGEYEIIEVKMPDKLRALELNAKLQGWLRDELRLEAGDGLTELLGAIRSGA